MVKKKAKMKEIKREERKTNGKREEKEEKRLMRKR